MLVLGDTRLIEHKFEGVQIARAIAALSVCYFHSWAVLGRFPEGTAHPFAPLAQHGWIGVDLFFAISGFVIGLVVSRSNFSVRPFLIRRVFRLYPLWLLMLSLYPLMAWRWPGLLPTQTIGSFFYSATLLPTENFPFYDIGWSLQHEMMFYVLAAVIVPIAGIGGLVVTLCITSVANHLVFLPWYISHFAFYHSEFLAGVLAFLALPYFKRVGWVAPIAVGLSTFYFFLIVWGGRPYFPIPLFFLILGAALIATPGKHSVLMGALTSLGDASYSIYLIHPLLFAFLKTFTIKLYSWMPLWIEEPLRLFSIAAVVAVSLMSFKFFEKPMNKLGERLSGAQSGGGIRQQEWTHPPHGPTKPVREFEGPIH